MKDRSPDLKVIGVDQEPKFYEFGGHRLKMISISDLKLPEAYRLMKAIASIGDLKDLTLVESLATVYGTILEPVLKFDSGQTGMFVLRRRCGMTPLRVLARHASVKEVGGVIQDFFVLNFGSAQPSDLSSLKTALTSRLMGAVTTSRTSSSDSPAETH